MPKSLIIKYALVNSLFTALYIILIGLFFANASRIFTYEPSPLIPMAMLMLFVFSAALTGSLMLGRPILWYIDGKWGIRIPWLIMLSKQVD